MGKTRAKSAEFTSTTTAKGGGFQVDDKSRLKAWIYPQAA